MSKHPSAVSLIIEPPASSLILPPVESVKTTEKHVDAEVQHGENVKKPPSKVDVPISTSIQTQIVRVDPVATHKLQLSTIKAQLELILSESTEERSKLNEFESVARSTKSVQSAESPTKESQFSFESKKHETGTDTMDKAFDKALDKTVCVQTAETRKCVSTQTLDEVERNEKEEKRNKYCKDDTMKEVGISVVDKTSKGMQSTICVSRGNSACRVSLEKKSELGTATSVHQARSVSCMTAGNVKEFKSNFVQCVSKEKLQATLTRSESHDSVKRCVRDVKSKHLIEKRSKHFNCNLIQRNMTQYCTECVTKYVKDICKCFI